MACPQVYKGTNEETGEAVAIKEVSWLKLRRRSPDLMERHQQNLRNEMECLQSLDHPNIVKLLGVQRADFNTAREAYSRMQRHAPTECYRSQCARAPLDLTYPSCRAREHAGPRLHGARVLSGRGPRAGHGRPPPRADGGAAGRGARPAAGGGSVLPKACLGRRSYGE